MKAESSAPRLLSHRAIHLDAIRHISLPAGELIVNEGGDYNSIEIGILNKQVVDSIKGKPDHVPPSAFRKACCIYRVHEKFRKINKNAYTPDTVAIGPFYRGEERLKAMEEYKLRYLHTLLDRTTRISERKLEEYDEAIRKLDEKAREYYSAR
ncbi:hypothetical protein HHK36_026286 [Tetracentron sinense]|uniref:Uncharacterized protein n=1 Tax=Tetracentron sinense TaxID=13715 RepID=A0A835D239_TETSI|nr:hypothetical protein HHK36_026286 [Tetracentron sinense]